MHSLRSLLAPFARFHDPPKPPPALAFDSALASALYRNIFNEQTDAATVARTVGYVRQQLAAVDGVGEEFMSDGVTPWK